VLNTETLAALKRQTRDWEPTAVDYSVHQRTMSDIQFAGGAVTSLIAHEPVIEFLHTAMGLYLVIMNVHFASSALGHPGMNLHTDSLPYGHVDWGYSFSVPRQVRVLYYLDELTPEVAPLRVVPRSHLSMHPDANPYKRYPPHPDESSISAPAGTAVVINLALFHANRPNTGDRSREMIAMSYRPA
jgi:ectoine hydroxylase-related dioxygenase (phytanoyl-CoA dioxygenase family)